MSSFAFDIENLKKFCYYSRLGSVPFEAHVPCAEKIQTIMRVKKRKKQIGQGSFLNGFRKSIFHIAALAMLVSCAQADVPGARNVMIPAPVSAQERKEAVNERPDSVLYLPLGQDVLVPEAMDSSPLPRDRVGPYELRSETLAGALQLILDDYDIPIAFETDEGLTRTVTITNLSGELTEVIDRVCGLADLYCAFDDGILVVKETQIFSVTVPPVDDVDSLLTDVSAAISEITGSTPITDGSTRTIVYRASHRTERIAKRYFQKLRSSTALIIFETYIWEVSLDSGNTTGINWEKIDTITSGKFEFGLSLPGGTDPEVGTPVSIGLPTTNGMVLDATDVLQFISEYGAVKTISQPQITVRSGASARLRVADTQNYVASVTRSSDDGVESVSTTTDSVDTGFELEIESDWDNATVYGTINILLQEVKDIETFDENPDAIVQLPATTERELETQLRVRPGDSLLIAGLVREIDNFDSSGPGAQSPLIPTSRSARTSNIELVIMMRPRVVVYTSPNQIPVKRAVKTAIDSSVASPAIVPHEEPVAIQEPLAKPVPVAPVKDVPEVKVEPPMELKAEPLPVPDAQLDSEVPHESLLEDMPEEAQSSRASGKVLSEVLLAKTVTKTPDEYGETYEGSGMIPFPGRKPMYVEKAENTVPVTTSVKVAEKPVIAERRVAMVSKPAKGAVPMAPVEPPVKVEPQAQAFVKEEEAFMVDDLLSLPKPGIKPKRNIVAIAEQTSEVEVSAPIEAETQEDIERLLWADFGDKE